MKNFIMKLSTILSLSFIVAIMPAYAGPTVDMKGPRTVRVTGEINGAILDVAAKLDKMSKESKQPINIIINSPGGSVPAGLQLVEALHIAQSRGVKIRCAVTTLAASMAYILLSQCDERYALANSLLLFHPARSFIFMGAIKAEEARYMAEELEAINKDMGQLLESSMGIVTAQQKTWFDYHTRNETLWLASRLSKAIPVSDWMTIVSDIDVDGPLLGKMNGDSSDEASVRNFLEQRSAR